MNAYRKKPVVIEALQWTGSNWPAMLDFCDVATANYRADTLQIATLEGTLFASPGDYVIRGVQGEFYPRKPDIFAATYEAVDAEAGPVVSSADGITRIAAERQRQIGAEGWTAEHDDEHDSGEMVYAAISYAFSPTSDVREAGRDYRQPAGLTVPYCWPWGDEWWKPTPKDRIHELTMAGALIAAEIDRLLRKGRS